MEFEKVGWSNDERDGEDEYSRHGRLLWWGLHDSCVVMGIISTHPQIVFVKSASLPKTKVCN